MTRFSTKSAIALICCAMPLAGMLTSCDDDDDYGYGGDGRLVGTWALVDTQNGTPSPSAYCDFFFAPDGSGNYGCYDNRDVWRDYDIDWWITGGGELAVQVVGQQAWYYDYDVRGRWLTLYPVPDYDNVGYLVFEAQ